MINTMERPDVEDAIKRILTEGTRVTINAAGNCKVCGSNSTCQVCHGTGHWASKPHITCTHCSGSGNCPG